MPGLAKRLIDSYNPLEFNDIPWTPVKKPLNRCKVAIVTTSGVHKKDQIPFDMNDKNGDPSYREIHSSSKPNELTITHDYYDHSDADRDINIVFPIERLKELEEEGIIAGTVKFHFSFMGHIDGEHIETLIHKTGPDIARKLIENNTDIVLLTPG